jgi:hypothetical protein
LCGKNKCMQGNLWKGKKLGYNPRLNSLLGCSWEGLFIINPSQK